MPGKAKVLRGKDVAEKLRGDIRARAKRVSEERGSAPLLAILSVAGGPASQIFLKNKLQACKDAGIETSVEALHDKISQTEVLRVMQDLASDPAVDGIILDLPVPKQLNARALVEAIPPDRDVEGMTAANLGRFYSSKSYAELQRSLALVPCTANAIIQLLLETGVDPAGKEAVVIGRSNIVGKPAAHLLSCLDATVTLAHSRTRDLAACVRRAEILVAAAGRARFIPGDWIKEGAIVLDAGVNKDGEGICGDVEFEEASRRAAFITPVPGGVGPLTVTSLLHNTVLSAERRFAPPE